jgi:hypothetical protein
MRASCRVFSKMPFLFSGFPLTLTIGVRKALLTLLGIGADIVRVCFSGVDVSRFTFWNLQT